MAVRSGGRAGGVVNVLILVWAFLRYVIAIAGFVCLLLTLTTLTGWFTVSAEGARLEWYWLLAAAFMLGFISTIGDKPFSGVWGAGSRLVAPDRLAPSLGHPVPEMIRAMLVAAVWGGLTYLLGLDLIVIVVVAALVGIALSLRQPMRRRRRGAARNRLTRSPEIQLPGDWEVK